MKSTLLDGVACLWKSGSNPFRNVARLVFHELAEPSSDVCFRDVDVVAGCHGWGTVTHEPSKGETIHAGLRCPCAKRVTPAVELERL